jgi:hypothetical protein
VRWARFLPWWWLAKRRPVPPAAPGETFKVLAEIRAFIPEELRLFSVIEVRVFELTPETRTFRVLAEQREFIAS